MELDLQEAPAGVQGESGIVQEGCVHLLQRDVEEEVSQGDAVGLIPALARLHEAVISPC